MEMAVLKAFGNNYLSMHSLTSTEGCKGVFLYNRPWKMTGKVAHKTTKGGKSSNTFWNRLIKVISFFGFLSLIIFLKHAIKLYWQKCFEDLVILYSQNANWFGWITDTILNIKSSRNFQQYFQSLHVLDLCFL